MEMEAANSGGLYEQVVASNANSDAGSQESAHNSSGAFREGGGSAEKGQVEEQWYSKLPEDLRGDVNITKYHSLEDMARGHVSAVSMLGRDKIPMPRTDAEYKDVFRRLGMPETKDDYAFDQEEYRIPEELYSKEMQAADLQVYRDWAYDAGLTQKQAASLYSKFMHRQEEMTGSLNRQIDAEMAKCDGIMRDAWGEATEANLAIANRAMSKFFGPNAVEAIKVSGLGRNFEFIQGLYQLGTRSLDELGIDKRGNSARTPEQLQEEIGRLQAHPGYFDRTHPEHRQVNDQVLALIERLGASR